MGPPFCDVATPLHEPTPVAAAATSGEMAELGAWTPGPGSEDTLLPLLCTAQFYPDRCLMSSMVTVNVFLFCFNYAITTEKKICVWDMSPAMP